MPIDALAALILLLPPHCPTPALSDRLCHQVRAVAVRWEVMDQRESYLSKPAEQADDLRILRNRVIEFADAPPLADLGRWPSRDCCREAMVFHRRYRELMLGRLCIDPWRWPERQELECACDQVYRVWDALYDAQAPYYYVPCRRRELVKFRSAIGPEAYAEGRVPSCVPVGRFVVMD